MSVPAKVTREDLESAFPWVRYLPEKAMDEFMAIVESYRAAARIYSRGHGDIPAEVVKAAQHYDYSHFQEDRIPRGGMWAAAADDQVRRLIWGALEAWRELGFILLPAEAGALTISVEEEPRPAAFLDEYDLSVIGLYKDSGEDEDSR